VPESDPTVLILTHSADYYTVDRVADAITRRGLRAIRFDTDQFPARARLSAHLDVQGDRLELQDQGHAVHARDVRAVWMRHVWKPALAENLEPRFRDGAIRESSAALRAVWDSLRDARWIDRPDAVARASDKLLQLRLAREAGLAIPRTLLTNDPQEARVFFDAVGGRMVAKMLTPLSVSMDASGPFVYTSRVRDSDLESAAALRHAPMLFQEEVPKARELRVVAVGGEMFVGALDASRSAGAVDWRRSDPAECHWERDTLAEDCTRSLRALLVALGLEYGAADLIRTPEGRYVFLEVNPAGEWGMLERDLGYPIAEALARGLCGES
jgi:MvdC family ATP-grasp ribosomal peptide maturase